MYLLLFLTFSPFFCCGKETRGAEWQLWGSVLLVNFQHSNTEDESTDDNSKDPKPPTPCDFDEPGCHGARNLLKLGSLHNFRLK